MALPGEACDSRDRSAASSSRSSACAPCRWRSPSPSWSIAASGKDIRFAEKEQAGNAYQRPLLELVASLRGIALLAAADRLDEADAAAIDPLSRSRRPSPTRSTAHHCASRPTR
jgi:hypothetical protein